jgi:hypothetical protein
MKYECQRSLNVFVLTPAFAAERVVVASDNFAGLSSKFLNGRVFGTSKARSQCHWRVAECKFSRFPWANSEPHLRKETRDLFKIPVPCSICTRSLRNPRISRRYCLLTFQWLYRAAAIHAKGNGRILLRPVRSWNGLFNR